VAGGWIGHRCSSIDASGQSQVYASRPMAAACTAAIKLAT